jgi:hypothetical protein
MVCGQRFIYVDTEVRGERPGSCRVRNPKPETGLANKCCSSSSQPHALSPVSCILRVQCPSTFGC